MKTKGKKKPVRYRIEPLEKKSIVTLTIYKTGDPSTRKEGDVMISREQTYRWGYAIVETSEKIDAKNDEIVVTDYDLIENEYDDGVALFWDYPKYMSNEDMEAIENAYNEEGDDGLAKLGWHYFDSEDKILGPFKIEKQ